MVKVIFLSFLSQQKRKPFHQNKTKKMLSCKTIILRFIVQQLLQNKNGESKQSRKTMTMTSFLKRKNVFKLFNEDIVCPFFLSISNVYNIIYFEKDKHWTLQRRSQTYSFKTELNHNRTWINLKWNSLNFQFLLKSINDNFV